MIAGYPTRKTKPQVFEEEMEKEREAIFFIKSAFAGMVIVLSLIFASILFVGISIVENQEEELQVLNEMNGNILNLVNIEDERYRDSVSYKLRKAFKIRK